MCVWNLLFCLLFCLLPDQHRTRPDTLVEVPSHVGRRRRKPSVGDGPGCLGVVELSRYPASVLPFWGVSAFMGDEAEGSCGLFASSEFLLRRTAYRHARIRGFLGLEQCRACLGAVWWWRSLSEDEFSHGRPEKMPSSCFNSHVTKERRSSHKIQPRHPPLLTRSALDPAMRAVCWGRHPVSNPGLGTEGGTPESLDLVLVIDLKLCVYISRWHGTGRQICL